MNPQNINEPEIIQTSDKELPKSPAPSSGFWSEIIKFTIIALLVVMPIRLFVAQPFIVNGASMDPTFATNQYLIVDQLTYHLENPQRGQIVIFKYPKDESKYFIKRIIGLPGETVELSGTAVIIHNAAHPEGFKLDEPYISPQNEMDNEITVKLKDKEYFVMGDNRLQSSDSRAWGTLPANLIIGTPFLRLFPVGKIGLFPGDYKEPN